MDKELVQSTMESINADQSDSSSSATSQSLVTNISTPQNGATIKIWLCVVILCIGSFTFGLTTGYSSPAISTIFNSKLHLSPDETMWFGSLVPLGAFFGGLVAGPLVDYFGRKATITLVCVPYLVGWLTLAYASNKGMLYAGRALTGWCTGIVSLAVPVYIAEIAPVAVRGIMGTCFQLSVITGVMVVYFIGVFVDFWWLALFCAFFPVILMSGMLVIPESPNWLYGKGQRDMARSGLRWFYGPETDLSKEIRDMDELLNQQLQNESSALDLMKPALRRPLLIGLILMFCQQFCGINAVLFYTVMVFKSAGSSLSPALSSLVVISVMFIATVLSLFLIDKLGRRLLLVISAVLMTVSLQCLAVFFYLKDYYPGTAENISILPLVSLLVYGTAFSIGYGPIPWLMMGELFPAHARGLASAIVTASNWLGAFLVTKYFQFMIDSFHDYGAYTIFSGVCIFSILFVLKFVPETKGKSLQEIEGYFKL